MQQQCAQPQAKAAAPIIPPEEDSLDLSGVKTRVRHTKERRACGWVRLTSGLSVDGEATPVVCSLQG